MIKYLEKKVEILHNENTTGLKRNIELEYYLLESETGSLGEINQEKVYGFEIVKKTGEEKHESEMIRNYSSSASSAKNVLEMLASNTVTPIALPFVLDDLLGY